MRNFNYNLMELLGDKFSFMERIQEINDKLTDGQVVDPHDIIDDLALSPAVKRAVWQALRIVDEVAHIKKALPTRIFVEVTRSNKAEKKKKDSRQKRLSDLYAAIKKDDVLLNGINNEIFGELKSSLAKYDDAALRSKKLYLYYTQMGRCAYTGEIIELSLLNTDNYDIDHIYPRSLTKDDSFDNLVLCKRTANAQKSDTYPISEEIQKAQKPFWTFLKQQGLISERKYERLTRITPLTADDLSGFIARQLVETNQSVKAATTLLRRLYPDIDVVFVKAENVTDFRHDNNFIKVRSLNHHHHAKDAYLNIVVGNVYHEKFTRNFRAFFKKNGANRTYNLAKMFSYDVKCTNAKDGKAWDVKTSMDTVKKMLASNDVRVTKRVYEQKGQLSDINLTKASKVKADIYLPIKANDPIMSQNMKYGGYSDIKNAYYTIIEYSDKKNNSIKAFIPIPIFIATKTLTKQALLGYIKTVLPKANLRIIYKKVYNDQLLKIDGFNYYLGGRSNDRFCIDNAIQLIVPLEIQFYIKLVEKFTAIISENKNIALKASSVKSRNPINNQVENITLEYTQKLFDYLVSKFNELIYLKMRGNKLTDVNNIGRKQFIKLSLEERCKALAELLNIFTNMNKKLSLSTINVSASRKVVNFKISSLDEFKIVNESITGLYSNEITIV